MERLIQLVNGLAMKLKEYDELNAQLKLMEFRRDIRENIFTDDSPQLELEKVQINNTINFIRKLAANAKTKLESDYNNLSIEDLRLKVVEARAIMDEEHNRLFAKFSTESPLWQNVLQELTGGANG